VHDIDIFGKVGRGAAYDEFIEFSIKGVFPVQNHSDFHVAPILISCL
jgi:hypothetical protein